MEPFYEWISAHDGLKHRLTLLDGSFEFKVETQQACESWWERTPDNEFSEAVLHEGLDRIRKGCPELTPGREAVRPMSELVSGHFANLLEAGLTRTEALATIQTYQIEIMREGFRVAATKSKASKSIKT